MTDSPWVASLRRMHEDLQVGEVPPAHGYWVSGADDPKPTAAEHASLYRDLEERVAAHLAALREPLPGAAYLRGDWFSMRSEELYAYGERFAGQPEALAEVVRLIQRALAAHPRWRVVFPLDEGPEASLAVYPGRIFCGDRLLDDAMLDELLARYVEWCQQQAAAR